MFKKIIVAVIWLFVFVCSPANAASTDKDKDAEISRLRTMVKQLITENQELRLQLANGTPHKDQYTPIATNAANPSTALKVRLDDSARTEQPSEKSYWLTTSSKKRHNSACRYYKTSKGSECGKDEGTPCKVCGG